MILSEPRTYIDFGDLNSRFINQLAPRTEDAVPFGFYGSNVLNVVILTYQLYQQAYEGTEYDASTVRDDQFAQNLIRRYNLFDGHTTKFWLDTYPTDLAIAFFDGNEPPFPTPDDITQATDDLEELIQAICENMEDVGFIYMGRFDSSDPASVQLIADDIRNHWGI